MTGQSSTPWFLLSLLLCAAACAAETSEFAPLRPVVEIEEEVYAFRPADNGAGPMWCSGSTCIVRTPAGIVISTLDTIPDLQPLNNCRWRLLRRGDDGWDVLHQDSVGRTREPSPITVFHDGRVFLSANPTLTGKDVYAGPARPEIVELQTTDRAPRAVTTRPKWDGTPAFSEHSYRSFAADGQNGQLILFQNIGYAHAEWTFRDAGGEWTSAGQLQWPWGAEYDKPQPVRICYPNVMLKDRAVYFCGVSDIVEPYAKWREYKKRLTGRDWDYDFRRLFFTWSDDITRGEFHPWMEIASRDATCGWIRPCDLWVDDERRVHILWIERALDERLRSEFFPEAKQSTALNYAVLERGEEVVCRTLIVAEEGGLREVAGFARFQVAPSGRLFVIYYVNGHAEDGAPVSENRVVELLGDGTLGEPQTFALKHPFVNFFTATVRGGSPPSRTVDLLGIQAGRGNTISYARVRLW